MIQFLLLSICYTAAFYISTSLADYYSPLMMMGIRGLISGSLILTFAYLYNGKIVFQFSKYKLQYFCAIIFGFLVPFVLHSAILDKLPPVDISVVATIEPILTYILAAYFFKEKLSSRQFWLFF